MLGSSGTCPRCYSYPICPYRISLGGDATPRELLLAEVPFPVPSTLVQRSLQTLQAPWSWAEGTPRSVVQLLRSVAATSPAKPGPLCSGRATKQSL